MKFGEATEVSIYVSPIAEKSQKMVGSASATKHQIPKLNLSKVISEFPTAEEKPSLKKPQYRQHKRN